jgi:release factor glutamine methyltransferase
LSREGFDAIMGLAQRRASGEPLAYVLGNAIFRSRAFITRAGVLIPRPETEILTEIARSRMERQPAGRERRFADWCAGSGCIAITLVLENPGWVCWAVDSSADAIEIARENAAAHGVADRVNFVISDSPSDAKAAIPPRSLDFVVSNPPYIPTGDIAALEGQVAGWEPREALDGGADGLDVYRLLLSELPALMKPRAEILFETGGPQQADEVALLGEGTFQLVGKMDDHRGISRFVLLKTPDLA